MKVEEYDMARARRNAVPVEEVDELDELEELDDEVTDEDGDDDLEELEEVEEEAPAPKARGRRGAKADAEPKATKKAAPAKAAAPKAESSGFDSNWLAQHVTEQTGVEYDSRGIRMLLRKLAAQGVLEREIGTDRARYEFPKGANDATVKAVVKMVKSGEATQVKREGLETAKATKAAKAAPAPAPAKTTKAAKAKAAPVEAAPAKKTTGRRRTRPAE